MAFVTAALVDAIAHSIDIPKLSAEAAKALAPDVEYKLRELIQDAQKFSRHARRQRLTTEDVNNALRMRNAEPIYGFSSKDPAKYIKAAGLQDVYAIEDKEVPVEQLVEQPLPRAPIEVGVMPHWLFISGVQPLTPENTPLERPSLKRPRPSVPLNQAAKAAAAAAGGAAAGAGKAGAEDAQAVQVQLPVQHVLPLELQLYFSKALEVIQAALDSARAAPPSPTSAARGAEAAATANGPGPSSTANQQQAAQAKMETSRYWGQLDSSSSGAAGALQPAGSAEAAGAQQGAVSGVHPGAVAEDGVVEDPKLAAVLASLATDPGLHALCPYLVKFIADGVTTHLANVPALLVLLRLARAILHNDNMGLEGYVHQLLPALLTCVVAKGIGGGSSAAVGVPDHGQVRQVAAQLVSEVCARFTSVHLNVQSRVSKTYLKALLDPTKPLTTHYGAVLGLAALGPAAVRLLLIPQLPAYLDRLQPLLPDTSSHPTSPPSSRQLQGPGSKALTASAMDMDADGHNSSPPPKPIVPFTSQAADGILTANGTAPNGQPQAAGVHGSLGHDALRVHGAFVDAVSSCLYDLMVAAAADAVPESDMALSRPSAAVLAKVAEALREQQPAMGVAESDRSHAAAVLTVAWKEEVGLSAIAWAACELLGPALQARLPQARPAHTLL